ncbi:MAG: orotidine 5'-phosphate decarboxylase / HUMPS family protein [Patescibacteria group bacterium]|nr:orotidine 5'-phosphate decarboxylase / HUMPS family protein [Patescibacteria group bacterium]
MLPKFFVANDASDINEAINKTELILDVAGDYGIKLNLDLVLKDINIISKIAKLSNKPIFVDMKMWNGKRTMNEAIKVIADQGAAMINVWAQADSMLEKAVDTAKKVGLTILGVTVLTHYDDDYCKKFFGRPMDKMVRLLAKTALKWGCDGYILPGTCLDAVLDLGGIKFNPAVRPKWFGDKQVNFQKQIMEPEEAFRKGADIVSCGSPVFKSQDPKRALELILEEIKFIHKQI